MKHCRRCGAPLAENELAGNCARCLTLALLSPETPESAPKSPTPTRHRLGDYELLEEVARGGMGVVFRARQVSLGREVALKILRDAWLATPIQVKRFRAEAANAARLKHPNIVSVHEVGEQDGQHFFAMDLVQGTNLAEATREGPLTPRHAAELVARVAEAVRHAHESGVLHRDLKPSNVVLDGDGEPHVTDFGLARPLDDESSLTLTGQVLGTPGYMAPEQAKGGSTVGPAADVYGLGALLFHLLTGRAPFAGSSTAETLTQVLLQEPLSPKLLNPAVPVDLAAVCLKCLAKRPQDRYGSAAELAEDLKRFLGNQTTRARPTGPIERSVRWCRRKPALAASALALVLVGTAGILGIVTEWQRAEAESHKFQFRSYIADMDVANRVLEGGDLGTVRELLSRYQPEPHQTDLRNWEWRYLAHLSKGDPHFSLAAHSTAVWSLRFLHTNTLLTAGIADWRTVLWDLKQLRPSMVITNLGGGGGVCEVMAAAPKRNTMYYRQAWSIGNTGIMEVNLRTGAEKLAMEVESGITWLDISVDQDFLAVANGSNVDVLDLVHGSWLQPFEAKAPVTQGLFSPDRTRLAVVEQNSGKITIWDVAEHRPVGSMTVSNAPDGLGLLKFSADGRWLVNSGAKKAVQIWNVENRILVKELDDSSFGEAAVFSPDGRWLAVVGGDPIVRLWETGTWRKARTLHGHTDPIASVDFSPDGHFLATGARNGEVKLWSLDQPPTEPERVSFSESKLVQAAQDGSGFARILQTGEEDDRRSSLIELWPTSPLRKTFSGPLPAGVPSKMMVLPKGRGVVLGQGDGSLRVIGPTGTQETVLTNAHQGDIYIMDGSLDGSTLATKAVREGYPESRIRIWRLPHLEPIAELQHATHIHGIKLSDDGKLLAGFTGPGDMGVWEIPSMKGPPMWRGVAALQRVEVAAFSPDNRWLAVATPDGEAILCELSTHRRIVLQRALSRYNSLSFSPDGSRLAAGSEGESKLFDSATGQVILSFKEQGLQLAFARDAERLLAVKREGAYVFHAPALAQHQLDWLKERPSSEAPAYLGPNTKLERPDRVYPEQPASP